MDLIRTIEDDVEMEMEQVDSEQEDVRCIMRRVILV
jgi:hypothetical protein